MDYTLEPYEIDGSQRNHTDNNTSNNNNWTTINRRMRRYKKTERTLMLNTLQYEEPYYTKFFNVTFPGKNIHTDIDIIRTDDEIKEIIGEPQKLLNLAIIQSK